MKAPQDLSGHRLALVENPAERCRVETKLSSEIRGPYSVQREGDTDVLRGDACGRFTCCAHLGVRLRAP